MKKLRTVLLLSITAIIFASCAANRIMVLDDYMAEKYPFIKDSVHIMLNRIAEDPADAEPVYRLGLKYFYEKDYDTAIKYFQQVVKRKPHDSEAHHAIFISEYLKRFDVNGEIERTDSIMAVVDSISYHTKLAVQFNPFFNRPLNLHLIPKDILESRNGKHDPFLQGFVKLFDGKNEEALAFFSLGSWFFGTFPVLNEYKGIALGRLGRHLEASLKFEELIEFMEDIDNKNVLPVYMNNASYYYMLAYTYWLSGRISEAEKTFKTVIEKDMTFYMTHLYLGLIQDHKGYTGLAIKEVERALAMAPDDPVLHYNLGRFYAKIKYYNEAAQSFLTAAKNNPFYYQPYIDLAEMFEEVGDPEKAKEHYNFSLQRIPKTDTVLRDSIENKMTGLMSLGENK